MRSTSSPIMSVGPPGVIMLRAWLYENNRRVSTSNQSAYRPGRTRHVHAHAGHWGAAWVRIGD